MHTNRLNGGGVTFSMFPAEADNQDQDPLLELWEEHKDDDLTEANDSESTSGESIDGSDSPTDGDWTTVPPGKGTPLKYATLDRDSSKE